MNDRISIRGLITQFDHLKLKLAMQGILVGIASGFMVVFYRMILEKAEHIRQLITLKSTIMDDWRMVYFISSRCPFRGTAHD